MNSYISLIYKTVFVLFILHFNPAFSQTVDSSHYYKINSIKIIGNKKTKERIILRELVKKQNDTLLLKNISRISKRGMYNIFNTQLFIFDSIKSNINDSNKTIDYTIKVKERWYIWPMPFIDYLDRNINTWLQTRDFNRLSYGVALRFENFSGVKDRLTLTAKTGYANQFGFNYLLPYLNSKQKLGAYIQYFYTEYNKLQYVTLNNQQQFVADANNHLRIDHSAKIGVFYRPRLFLQHSLDIGYANINVSKNIIDLNPNYFFKSATTTSFASLLYRLTYDTRDNRIYPLKGYMLEFLAAKDGFDLSANSKINLTQAYFSAKKYFPIHRKLNLAMQVRGRYLNSPQQIPFAFNQGMGYSSYIRGYEYYVIDGQNYFLTRNSLRFQIIKPKFHEVNMLKKLKSFSTIPFYTYLNIFYDGGYVSENIYKPTNNLANSWQYGYGIGLDFITYYDLVLRVEYTINKQQQSGIYLHFTSGF